MPDVLNTLDHPLQEILAWDLFLSFSDPYLFFSADLFEYYDSIFTESYELHHFEYLWFMLKLHVQLNLNAFLHLLEFQFYDRFCEFYSMI